MKIYRLNLGLLEIHFKVDLTNIEYALIFLCLAFIFCLVSAW